MRAAAGLALAALLGSATAFPDRPVRIVAGFQPGGADVSARLIAPQLQALWGQPVIIDNKPGAAGNLGADAVARAAPDGHTLLLYVNSYAINTSVYKSLGWDLLRDFTPVGRYGNSPMVVVVHPALPVKDLRGLISLAKAQPGALNYGSAGVATAPHLAVEWFAAEPACRWCTSPTRARRRRCWACWATRCSSPLARCRPSCRRSRTAGCAHWP